MCLRQESPGGPPVTHRLLLNDFPTLPPVAVVGGGLSGRRNSLTSASTSWQPGRNQ